jgi:hypothetical protein
MDDDMHMPPKGKPQPTPREISILRDWIAAGAPFGPVETATEKQQTVTGTTLPARPEIPAPAGPSAPDMSETVETSETIPDAAKENPQLLSALASLNALGLSATIEGDGLGLNFVNLKEITPDILHALEPHRAIISSLNLRGLPVNDATISGLPEMPALHSVNLSRTDITDKAIRNLTRFAALERLTLYETAVSDAAIPDIARLNKLKALNTWSTRVTDNGVRTLLTQKPTLQIESGSATLRKPDSTQRKKP